MGNVHRVELGTAKAATLMEEKDWNTDLLEELSSVMVDASICGLGQAAPKPDALCHQIFPDD